MLHIPGLGFDGLVGYSPIAMAKNAIGNGTLTYVSSDGDVVSKADTSIDDTDTQNTSTSNKTTDTTKVVLATPTVKVSNTADGVKVT